jgi:hypothetical protein
VWLDHTPSRLADDGAAGAALAARCAAYLRSDPTFAAVTARDGHLVLTLAPATVAAALAVLADGEGMPPAPDPLPTPRTDGRLTVARLAHARACGVERRRVELAVTLASRPDPLLLDDPAEEALLAELLDSPRRLAGVVSARADATAALVGVGTAYHPWWERCPALPMRPGEQLTDRHRARLVLNRAAQRILDRGLSLLGLDAPTRM